MNAVDPTPLRRFVLTTLAAGLSLAALLAIAGIITGDLGHTNGRVILTSLAFSVFCALGAAGARGRRREVATLLVTTTQAGAAVSFSLLMLLLWVDHGEVAAQAFGIASLASLAAAHACLVLSAARPSDPQSVSALVRASIITASLFSALLILLIAGAIDTGDESVYLRLVGVDVILMLLSTALPPVLRRLDRPVSPQPITEPAPDIRAELSSIAGRLERLAPAAGKASSELLAEVARLRALGS